MIKDDSDRMRQKSLGRPAFINDIVSDEFRQTQNRHSFIRRKGKHSKKKKRAEQDFQGESSTYTNLLKAEYA